VQKNSNFPYKECSATQLYQSKVQQLYQYYHKSAKTTPHSHKSGKCPV